MSQSQSKKTLLLSDRWACNRFTGDCSEYTGDEKKSTLGNPLYASREDCQSHCSGIPEELLAQIAHGAGPPYLSLPFSKATTIDSKLTGYGLEEEAALRARYKRSLSDRLKDVKSMTEFKKIVDRLGPLMADSPATKTLVGAFSGGTKEDAEIKLIVDSANDLILAGLDMLKTIYPQSAQFYASPFPLASMWFVEKVLNRNFIDIVGEENILQSSPKQILWNSVLQLLSSSSEPGFDVGWIVRYLIHRHALPARTLSGTQLEQIFPFVDNPIYVDDLNWFINQVAMESVRKGLATQELVDEFMATLRVVDSDDEADEEDEEEE